MYYCRAINAEIYTVSGVEWGEEKKFCDENFDLSYRPI
jgi:hypothetical protein